MDGHLAYYRVFPIYAAAFIGINIINFIVTIGGFIFVESKKEQINIYIIYTMYGIIFIISLVVAIYAWTYFRQKRINAKHRSGYGFPQIILESTECKLSILRSNNYLFERKATIRSYSDGEKYFRFAFGYTGSIENCQIESSKNIKATIATPAGMAEPQIFVEFISPLKQSSREEIVISVKINDIECKMKNHFGYTCTFPVENYVISEVEFEIGLPAALTLKKYKRTYFVASENVEYTKFPNLAHKKLRRPRLGQRYLYEW
jgi:hypothetical protein